MGSIETASQVPDQNMLSVVKRQRIQDFFFHKITLGFSLLVLFALLGIIISLFVFFNSFALVQYLQYKGKGKWSNYLRGERAYIVLSLVAKSALA